MSQQLQAQANAVLYRALEQPPAERHTFIEQACADCRELADLVKSMLAHIDQLDAFLDEPLAAASAVEQPAARLLPQAGDQVGPWEVLETLPRSALGYPMLVAHLEDAERRPAVLTIVDAAALSLEQLALFNRQRQLLGSLTHPGLARLLDSGTLADGEPFIVLEHAAGRPIDAFCRETGASRETRIALLVQACLALHHAHQRLLPHRHLRAEHVLVSDTGALKVTDFDVAGLVDDDTHSTPSTADDIAALGALLRKLLLDGGPRLPHALQAIVDHAAEHGSADQLARALQDYLGRAVAPAAPTLPTAPEAAPAAENPARRRPLASAIAAALLVASGAGATLAWQQLRPATATSPGVALKAPPANAAAAPPAAQRQAPDAAALLGRAEAHRLAGDLAGARAAADAALDLSRAGSAQHAAALQALGTILLEQGDTPGALAQLRAGLAAHLELAEQLTGEAGKQARLAAADARVALAQGLVAGGAYAAADGEYQLARAAHAALPSDAARGAIARIDLARADAQYLRKHWRTAGQTVRALRAALPAGADGVLQARAALLEALIQPGGTAAQAYAAAQKALPVLLFDFEADPHNLPKLRASALAWRRVGEIAARAEQPAAACDYYALAEKRYAELERGQRLNALDREARRQLAELRTRCG